MNAATQQTFDPNLQANNPNNGPFQMSQQIPNQNFYNHIPQMPFMSMGPHGAQFARPHYAPPGPYFHDQWRMGQPPMGFGGPGAPQGPPPPMYPNMYYCQPGLMSYPVPTPNLMSQGVPTMVTYAPQTTANQPQQHNGERFKSSHI